MEYDSLRKELEFLSADLRALEKYVIFGIAATWAWLATQTGSTSRVDNEVLRLAWRHIPVMFSVLGALRAWSLSEGIKAISDYISDIEKEDEFLGDAGGWETQNRKIRNSKKGIFKKFDFSVFAVWITLIAFSLFVPNPFK